MKTVNAGYLSVLLKKNDFFFNRACIAMLKEKFKPALV